MGAGRKQSPIDISHARIDPRLRPLKLHLEPTPIALANNGHTIEQDYEPGSTLALVGTTYHLQQFHFHALSEHTIGGQRGVMEQHLVFKDDLANPRRVVVVAMLYEIGHKNPFLARLATAGLPMQEGDTVRSRVSINVAQALTEAALSVASRPADRRASDRRAQPIRPDQIRAADPVARIS